MATEPEFLAPSGFGPPQGTKPGDTFNAVCELRLKPDGKTLCAVSLDGSKFLEKGETNEYEEETVVEEKETPKGREMSFEQMLRE